MSIKGGGGDVMLVMEGDPGGTYVFVFHSCPLLPFTSVVHGKDLICRRMNLVFSLLSLIRPLKAAGGRGRLRRRGIVRRVSSLILPDILYFFILCLTHILFSFLRLFPPLLRFSRSSSRTNIFCLLPIIKLAFAGKT